jgi:hypothetical protein
MVTRAGTLRRSLRRPIANVSSVTPKALCPREALGDHQQNLNSLFGLVVDFHFLASE